MRPLPLLARIGGIVFIMLQVGLAVHLRLAPEREFHLSPHEGLTRYRLFATVGTTSLSPDALERRYHLSRRGETALSPEQLRAIVRHCEKQHPHAQPAFVRLHTEHNGASEEIWLWPES
jgi:hypothetical protein